MDRWNRIAWWALAVMVVCAVGASALWARDDDTRAEPGATAVAYDLCKDAVADRLAYPAEAEFVSLYETVRDSEMAAAGAGETVWRSTVVGSNGFGVRSAVPFVCRWRAVDGVVQVVNVDLDD